MEINQDLTGVSIMPTITNQGAVPKVVPEPEIKPEIKPDKPPEFTEKELEIKEEAEGIVEKSVERLKIAEKLGIDITKPKDTMKLYRHAYLQKDFEAALKLAKKIAIESAQVWNLTLKKRIELAKSGQVDPTKENDVPAGQNAQETRPKVPTIVKPGTKKREPPRPKVVATRKIRFANGKNNGNGKEVKKKPSVVESIKSFFGKKDTKSIEERLSRAEMMLNRAKGLEEDEDGLSMESLDERMAKIESEIKKEMEK